MNRLGIITFRMLTIWAVPPLGNATFSMASMFIGHRHGLDEIR
jgi:hypothetical protein